MKRNKENRENGHNIKRLLTKFMKKSEKVLKNIAMLLITVSMVSSITYVACADEGNERVIVTDGKSWREIEEQYIKERIEYINTEQEGNEFLFDTDREINLLFVGNSRFGEPKVPEYFEELSERYHLNVNVYEDIWYGKSIDYRFEVIDSEYYDYMPEYYAKADVIIFHEYAWDYDTTYEDICRLVDNYCKKDVVVYYYTLLSDYDCYDYLMENPYMIEDLDYPLRKIADDERMHIIDYGRIFNTFYNMNSTHDYLYKSDHAHPNQLSGLMAAGYIYTQMYKTVFTDYQYSELNDVIKSALPGNNDAEKEEFYNKMIDVLNKGVTDRDYSNIPMYVGPEIEKDSNQNDEIESGHEEKTEENTDKNIDQNVEKDTAGSNEPKENVSDTQQAFLDDKDDQQKTETKVNVNEAAEGKTSEKSKAAPKTGDSGETTALILFTIAGSIAIVAKKWK